MVYVFINDTATTEICTLSLHDALPISDEKNGVRPHFSRRQPYFLAALHFPSPPFSSRKVPSMRLPETRPLKSRRSEEHTSELQSRQYLVCRLLLEKKTAVHKCNIWTIN